MLLCHLNFLLNFGFLKKKERRKNLKQFQSSCYLTPPTHAQTLIMIIWWFCILHASHAAKEWRGALRGLATVRPPAEMRGEVRAKERGVWRGAYQSRLLLGAPMLSLFLSVIPPFFLHPGLIYFSPPNCSFSLPSCSLQLVCLMNHRAGPHLTSLPPPINLSNPRTPPSWAFPHLHLIHWPPRHSQSTPLPQIIILSAVTKEMHTPSITMYKFSVCRFGQVLIKKPFHSFSWEIIRLSSHQDATSMDPFSSCRKPIGGKKARFLTTLLQGTSQ